MMEGVQCNPSVMQALLVSPGNDDILGFLLLRKWALSSVGSQVNLSEGKSMLKPCVTPISSMAILFFGSSNKHCDVERKRLTDFHRLGHPAPSGKHSHGTKIFSHSAHPQRFVHLLLIYMQAKQLDYALHTISAKYSVALLLLLSVLQSCSFPVSDHLARLLIGIDQFASSGHFLDKEIYQVPGSEFCLLRGFLFLTSHQGHT